MTYLLGLDISTTGAKALIIDEHGTVIASQTAAQPISNPKPLWSEQNPSDWWQGMTTAIKGALAEASITGDAIAAVGLTGQMHGMVLLDESGTVLRPAILWNDGRTQPQCDAITAKIGFERLIELTGNRALTGFTAPKILWVRENEPEVYARAAHLLLPKDYIRYQLTGDYAMDLSDAAGTLLLNVAERTWSAEVVNALDIPMAWLPALYEGSQVTGVINAAGAAATGLKAGTPVVGGGGDQAAGAVGVGAVEPHIIGLSVGTSGVVFAPLAKYAYEPQGSLHAFCHAVPGQWHFMGVMLSAAGSLQWYKDSVQPAMSFDELLAETTSLQPGCEGLFFLPYLSGERTPHPDPNARGAFIGLTTRHQRAAMTRAVLEGVAFGLKDSFTLIAEAGIPATIEVRISGGGAKSPIWQQIIADVLNAPIASINTTEGAAFGAALLAAVGAGIYPDVQAACKATIKVTSVVQPSEQAQDYAALYGMYRKLYPALKDIFAAL